MTAPGRLLWALPALALIVAGCAAPEPRDEPGPDYALMDEIARSLVGHYTNHAQWRRQDDSGQGPVRLEIRVVPADNPRQVALSLLQQESDGAQRDFLVTLAPAEAPGQLRGSFTPRTGAARSCPMRFTVHSDGFVGQTDPGQCRFGEGAEAVGLLKELAHDGRQLVIGDRLVSLVSGEPVGEDRILRLDRVRIYSGWAGSRDSDAGDWRLARSVRLESGGGTARPVDAAGMDLGFELELSPFIWRDGDAPILRLSAVEVGSGRLLGHAWADLDAEQIGLALPGLQVGLNRERD